MRQHVRRPGHRSGQQHLTPTEQRLGITRVACQHRAARAANCDAHQEHRQDDGERVDRRAQHQSQQARPDDFRPKRGCARKRDGQVYPPRSGRNRRLGLVGRLVLRSPSGQRETHQPHGHIDGRRYESGRCHVEYAQQVEAREQAADYRAHRVRAVKHPEHADAFRRRLDPARRRGQGRAHQERGRQQAESAHQGAQQDGRHPVPHRGGVDRIHQGHQEQHQNAAGPDAEFQLSVHPQRMLPAQLQPRQQEAPQAQPAHKRGQQHAERNRAGPDHQLQQLIPDDFIDQRGAAAAREQQ